MTISDRSDSSIDQRRATNGLGTLSSAFLLVIDLVLVVDSVPVRVSFLPFLLAESRLMCVTSTVEGVAVLSLIMKKYSVHLAEDLDGSAEKRRLAGETFEEKVKRVMQCRSVITLTPGKTSLVFRER